VILRANETYFVAKGWDAPSDKDTFEIEGWLKLLWGSKWALRAKSSVVFIEWR
jgi:hypothetical protein